MAQKLQCRALFLDATALHDDEAMRAVGRHAQVVGDQQHGGAGFAAQLVDQIQDAPLHRDIQRAGGLVGDDQRRPQRDGDGDQHTLAHAARQLVRILARPQGGLGQAHAGQQVDHACLDGRAVAQAVNAQDFAYLVAHGAHGVERGGRVLRHQAEHAAANAVPARGAPVRDLGALQPDAALLAAPVVGEQANHGLGRGGLARARFADQGHDLAGRHGKRQAVDHALFLAAVVAVGDDQVLDFEQRGGG